MIYAFQHASGKQYFEPKVKNISKSEDFRPKVEEFLNNYQFNLPVYRIALFGQCPQFPHFNVYGLLPHLTQIFTCRDVGMDYDRPFMEAP